MGRRVNYFFDLLVLDYILPKSCPQCHTWLVVSWHKVMPKTDFFCTDLFPKVLLKSYEHWNCSPLSFYRKCNMRSYDDCTQKRCSIIESPRGLQYPNGTYNHLFPTEIDFTLKRLCWFSAWPILHIFSLPELLELRKQYANIVFLPQIEFLFRELATSWNFML